MAAVLNRVDYKVDRFDCRMQFEIGETSRSKAIDARIVPNIGPVSTRLAEAKRIQMLRGPDLEHENNLVLRAVECSHAAIAFVPYADVLQLGKDPFAGVQHFAHVSPVHEN